ncbi:hypothetical protein [Paenibacillus sp. GYB003]|uniref:hypothetical protein n=1 Tax=Paenibacillus sp. GYB003 TaxID=2994392 RepID=UPI002F96C7C1
MIRHGRGAWPRKVRTILLSFVILCFALTPYAALAGKEGVYISGDVYFTLENVRFSEGSDDSILRFSVALHNGSDSAVDYNYFGARVTDSSGFSYSAQLAGQHNARVQPGKEQLFAYEARVAKGLSPAQLRVAMFAWNYGTTVSMTDLGSFSVAAAMEEAAEAAPEAIVPLGKVDAALAADDLVRFRVGGEYFVVENGDWSWYAELVAENAGDSGLSLPAGLKLRLENAAGQTVAATAVDGADKSLLPGKPQRITVKASIPAADLESAWALQFYYSNGTDTTVLDSLPVGRSKAVAAIGDARPITDASGQEAVSVKVESAVISQSDSGQWVSAKVSATNNGSKVVAVPKLSAKVQSSGGGVSVAAEDPSSHAAYLSPSESETFSFSALMPKGVDPADMQFALFENRGSASTSAANGGSGSSNSSNANANGNSSSNTNANTGNSNANANGSANHSASSSSSSISGSQAKIVPVLLAGLSGADIYKQGSGDPYTLGDKLDLALDKKVDVALSELRMYDNETNGFKTAVAKLKFTNADTTVLATPDLAFELVDESGRIYSGTKQATAAAQLATNSSYLIAYSFLMSSVDESKPLLMRIYNAKDAGKVPLGTVQVAFQQDDPADDVWNAFPYQVTLHSKLLLHSVLSTTFSYTLRFDVDLQRKEQIIADAGLSKLQFELVDGLDQVISTQTLPFQGTTKLLNGSNELTFTNLKLNQYSSKNYMNVYEVVDTPNGAVKRKLAEFR